MKRGASGLAWCLNLYLAPRSIRVHAGIPQRLSECRRVRPKWRPRRDRFPAEGRRDERFPKTAEGIAGVSQAFSWSHIRFPSLAWSWKRTTVLRKKTMGTYFGGPGAIAGWSEDPPNRLVVTTSGVSHNRSCVPEAGDAPSMTLSSA